jgi:hypothetical protein
MIPMTDKYTDEADWLPDDDIIVPYAELSEDAQITAQYNLRESLDYLQERLKEAAECVAGAIASRCSINESSFVRAKVFFEEFDRYNNPHVISSLAISIDQEDAIVDLLSQFRFLGVRNELELKLVRSVTIRAINSVCSAEVTACAGLEDETIAEMQNVLTGYAGKIYDIAQKVAEDFVLESYYRSSMHAYLVERNTMCCENGEIVDG